MLFESSPNYEYTLRQAVNSFIFPNFQPPKEDQPMADPAREPHELLVTTTFSFDSLPPQSTTVKPLQKEKYRSLVLNPYAEEDINLSPQRFTFEDQPTEITVQVTTKVGQRILFNGIQNYRFSERAEACESSFRVTCNDTEAYQVIFNHNEPR